MTVDGVLLDLDHTLCDSGPIGGFLKHRVRELLVDGHIPEDGYDRFFGRYEAITMPLYERSEVGGFTIFEFLWRRFQHAFAPWGSPPRDLFDRYLSIKELEFGHVRLYDETPQALERLRAAGIRTAIVTNGPSDLQRLKLDHLGIAAAVDAVVISGEVRRAKPDPAVYRHALSLIDVRPEDAIMVGDSLSTDVPGARAVPMRVVWISPNGDEHAGLVGARGIAGAVDLILSDGV